MQTTNTTYKQTELGLIPQDWEITTFDNVLTGFSSGQTPYRANKEFYKGDIPWITSGELNYNTITETLEKITKEGVKSANLKMIPRGTFLFAITGLEAQGTRGSCAITGIEATTNQSCMALYPIKGKITTEYLYHFYVRFGNELAFKYCQGTKQQSFTGAIAKILPIILPPTLSEQTAIANALSNVDNLIEGLEKIIAKKKLIKKGALQKLLKPKKGWVNKRLGEIGKVYGGLSGKNKNDFENGDKLYIPFMNVMSNTIIDTNDLCYVNISNNELQNKVSKNDLIFNGSSETPEEVGMCSVLLHSFPELYLNSFCFGYRLTNTSLHYPLYLSFYFRSSFGRNLIYSLSQGATRYNLSKSNFLNLIVPIPTIKEQEEIADILTDMDNEIDLLQNKLNKYQQVKQGMMQNLLTGKIRLNHDLKDNKIT